MNETVQGEVTAVAAATGSKDPEVALAAVAALRGLVEVLEAWNVENARDKGWSWDAMAPAPPRRSCEPTGWGWRRLGRSLAAWPNAEWLPARGRATLSCSGRWGSTWTRCVRARRGRSGRSRWRRRLVRPPARDGGGSRGCRGRHWRARRC